MRFPLFSIQAMTDDFPEKLPLLKEWISPKGLREISITFLLVAQLVTEREKETGQYFKAKTSIGNSRYRTSIFLNCLIPKHDFCLFVFYGILRIFCLIANSLIWSGFPWVCFWVPSHERNWISCASERKAISGTRRNAQTPGQLDDRSFFTLK